MAISTGYTTRGYDPVGSVMQNPQSMYMLQAGYRPVVDGSGRVQWLPPLDPEAGLPSNLRMEAIQQSMNSAKNADRQKYISENVNPALSQQRAAMIAMGNRGSFGAQQLSDITNAGNTQADAFGEEAAGRAFGNLVNLRNQYLSGRQIAQGQQDRDYGSITDALSMARQQQQLNTYGGSGGGSDFQSGLGQFTKGRALMQGLQGVGNMLATNPQISQGYKSGGLFGAAMAVPKAAGKILFGL